MKMKLLASILAVVAAAPALSAAQVMKLTMAEAVQLALKQNRSLKIARLGVQDAQEKRISAKSRYFPTLGNESSVLRITELQNIVIPAAAFGTIPGVGGLPPHPLSIDQGKNTVVLSNTILSQPLTQLIRIHQANKAAAADVASSKDENRKGEVEVAFEVHQMYYALLVAQLNRQAVQQQAQYTREDTRENTNEVGNGAALQVTEISNRADLLQSKQNLLTADLQIDDLSSQFNDLLGLPIDTKLELDPAVDTNVSVPARDQCLTTAWTGNPEIRLAQDTVRKASAGVATARTKYIPDITAFAQYTYADGVPFFVHNFGTFGVNMKYDVFDFGRRHAEVREAEIQLREAKENLQRLKDEVAVQVEQTYSKLERSKALVDVAQQVVHLRTETERVTSDQFKQGVVLVSDQRKASAAVYTAKADLLQADLAYVLARAELDEIIGVVSQF